MKNESVLKVKSFEFSVRVVNAVRFLQKTHKEYVLSKQLLRSDTAVGALIAESEFAQSKPDFVSKLSIALKEANETKYWLELLNATEYLETKAFKSIESDISELIAMLVSSVKTTKMKIKNEKLRIKQ